MRQNDFGYSSLSDPPEPEPSFFGRNATLKQKVRGSLFLGAVVFGGLYIRLGQPGLLHAIVAFLFFVSFAVLLLGAWIKSKRDPAFAARMEASRQSPQYKRVQDRQIRRLYSAGMALAAIASMVIAMKLFGLRLTTIEFTAVVVASQPAGAGLWWWVHRYDRLTPAEIARRPMPEVLDLR